jgi:zinc protease
VLELIREVLSNTDFDRHELRLMKKQRMLGWSAARKSPYFRAGQEVATRLFEEGDPRRWAWEKPDSVETDADKLVEARDRGVRLPGRVVGLAGDLTRAEAERLAGELLPSAGDDPPAGVAPRFLPLVPASDRPRRVVAELPKLTQVYFGYGRESVRFTDPDYPAFLVANHVLGGHFYSRLYVALRHEGGETYGAGSRNLGDVVEGPYGVATFTRVANAPRTETKLREVLRVFHEKGITEEEREETVGYLVGSRAFGRQAPVQLLQRTLYERRLGLEPGFMDGLVDRAAALSLEEVNEFISRYYDPAAFSMVLVAPEE